MYGHRTFVWFVSRIHLEITIVIVVCSVGWAVLANGQRPLQTHIIQITTCWLHAFGVMNEAVINTNA